MWLPTVRFPRTTPQPRAAGWRPAYTVSRPRQRAESCYPPAAGRGRPPGGGTHSDTVVTHEITNIIHDKNQRKCLTWPLGKSAVICPCANTHTITAELSGFGMLRGPGDRRRHRRPCSQRVRSDTRGRAGAPHGMGTRAARVRGHERESVD